MATSEDSRLLRLAPPAPYLSDGEDLPCVYFLAEIAAGGLSALAHDSFHGVVDPAMLEEAGEPEFVRAKVDGNVLEAFVRLDDGVVALVDFDHGHLWIQVAGPDMAAARRALEELRGLLRRPEPSPTSVPFAFWSRAACGGAVRHRSIEVPRWEDVRANYTAPVAAALERLVGLSEPAGGRLMLWRGSPGTGKTYALRALASAWRTWCTVHYVLDPFALMSQDPSYLLDLLTWEDDDGDRWRLAVLEDAGELIVLDAARTGALNALLNVTDGILAQGTRTIVLVTTNEPIERLHPAVHRPGRCLADIEFGPLTVEEAAAWLRRAGSDEVPARPLTLAELYGIAHGDASAEPVRAERAPFGFGRALRA